MTIFRNPFEENCLSIWSSIHSRSQHIERNKKATSIQYKIKSTKWTRKRKTGYL